MHTHAVVAASVSFAASRKLLLSRNFDHVLIYCFKLKVLSLSVIMLPDLMTGITEITP